ncbi:MAG: hypothetical protein A3A58_03535 [Candidatus Blackburnbacteria bacterium RIFCSPLOWO2_01_FULL_41_27]|uniref:GIY-YIG domain-containing protein n=2 Tax=Candidatus Blackburniibacteriota TaxID=1817898 RepID=A0A1G1V722_9BACT|nr:MAG: hypothetical protein A3F61_04325 [Candidatus Blackburnbacteria bacterium RIFCSPHIGHO2_12_FULL_41_13b]OGY13697.1 MAG: hypothetical protein A3A58_03535 [Candidatus Blackburnbacteria bacterium RIFCSPLOWO2_01_FULL_41_27]
MYYVYILISQKDRMLYVGYATDLKRRFQRHKNGFVAATKNRLPVELIHYEAYLTQSDAKRREVFLKGGKGHAELKIQIEKCLRKVKYKYL